MLLLSAVEEENKWFPLNEKSLLVIVHTVCACICTCTCYAHLAALELN